MDFGAALAEKFVAGFLADLNKRLLLNFFTQYDAENVVLVGHLGAEIRFGRAAVARCQDGFEAGESKFLFPIFQLLVADGLCSVRRKQMKTRRERVEGHEPLEFGGGLIHFALADHGLEFHIVFMGVVTGRGHLLPKKLRIAGRTWLGKKLQILLLHGVPDLWLGLARRLNQSRVSVQLLLDRPAGLGHGRHMDWISRKLTLPPPLAPFIEERLVAAGWTSLSSERATGDRRVTLRVYVRPGEALPAPEDFAGWIAEAETAGLPGARLRFEDDEFDEQDWNAAFREHFVPREVIPGLTVVPPWNMTGPVHQRGEPMPGSNADLSLVIEPALAFGTGDHPTTQMCLEMLRDYAREREASGKPWDCLDIGSGTGILSIAAKLWGARRVEGFDIDKRSILNAYLNADLNGLAGDVRFRWGEPKDLGEKQWDIVVCNLFLTPIQKYLSQMAKAADPNGILVLSGFLDEQQEKVTDLACMKNLKLTITKQKDHWVSQLWVKTSN